MGKKGGSTKSTQTSAPYLANQVNTAANAATTAYNNGGGYYTGTRLADTDPATLQALDQIAARANGVGADLTNASSQQYLDTINGKYLEGNPYLQNIIDANAGDVTRNFTNQILPQLNSTFAQSGRYGSGLQEQSINDAVNTTSQNIADTAGNLRYQNYAGERANQLNAVSNAGAVNAQGYQNSNQLLTAGTAQQAIAQARLDDQIAQQELPQQALQDYIARITALNQGYGTQTTRQSGGSSLLGTLGGLASIGGAIATGGSSLGLFGAGAIGAAAPLAGSIGGYGSQAASEAAARAAGIRFY